MNVNPIFLIITLAATSLVADWRSEADARIEALRKGDFRIILLDATGQPLEGASVSAVLARHAFEFGSATNPFRLVNDSSDHLIYREVFLDLFNSAVTENALKQRAWGGEWSPLFDQSITLAGLQWLQNREIYVRGHVLVWPRWSEQTAETIALRDAGLLSEIPPLLLAHFDDIMGQTSGLLDEWDVSNETLSDRDLVDPYGEEIIDSWFTRAHSNQPTIQHFLNETNLLTGVDAGRVPRFTEQVQRMLARGALIDGLGAQGHFTQVRPIDEIKANLDALAALGLPIKITEFDYDTFNVRRQARFTADFVRLAFSHPAVQGFYLWGFWEGAHWRPKAALYRGDWYAKPNLRALQHLLHEEWHTDVVGITDNAGQFAFRGYLGTYWVTLNLEDRSYLCRVTLEEDGASQTIEFPLGLADDVSLLGGRLWAAMGDSRAIDAGGSPGSLITGQPELPRSMDTNTDRFIGLDSSNTDRWFVRLREEADPDLLPSFDTPTPPTAPAIDGLVAHYAMEEGPGSYRWSVSLGCILDDCEYAGLGRPSWVPGRKGAWAGQLDGSSAMIATPWNYPPSYERTVAFWFRVDGTVPGFATLFNQAPLAVTPLGAAISSNGTVFAFINGLSFSANDANYADGEWHHFAVTVSGTHARLYLDGQFKVMLSNVAPFNNGDDIHFGGFAQDGSINLPFNGSFDDIVLVDRALSDEEITTLMND